MVFSSDQNSPDPIFSPGEGQLDSSQLPSALTRQQEIFSSLAGRKPVVFLDYDGTLTPIVERPELALLSSGCRAAVRRLAGKCTVAVVSGRDRRDVEKLVGIPGLCFIGSHGFDIADSSGRQIPFAPGDRFLDDLADAEQVLREVFEDVPGVLVERKKYAVAVHYRLAPKGEEGRIGDLFEQVARGRERLRRFGGKKVMELRPDFAWDKGKAVMWLLQRLSPRPEELVPLYLGDDLTDEDAFRALRDTGIGVLVRDARRPTAARYALESTEEVERFLDALTEFLSRKPGRR